MGTPEELVLNGSFERAFHSEGVDFDARSGMFRLHKDSAGEVEVHGDSLHAIWTARGSEANIKISVSPDGTSWTLRRNGTERIFDLLESVLNQLRH